MHQNLKLSLNSLSSLNPFKFFNFLGSSGSTNHLDHLNNSNHLNRLNKLNYLNSSNYLNDLNLNHLNLNHAESPSSFYSKDFDSLNSHLNSNVDSDFNSSNPKDVSHYLRAGTLNLSVLPPLSLYVHLPWCLQKCPYCDFNSHEFRPLSSESNNHKNININHQNQGLNQTANDLSNDLSLPEKQYIDALFSDLEVTLPLIWGRPILSIFIGGGTPSLFSPESIHYLISGLRARLPLEAGCEITLEANPGTFEKNRFRDFAKAGVTRLSIGVQSFNDRHLKALGRVHNRAQAIDAIREAAIYFETYNLDLMYALPEQTFEELEDDIQTALDFNPPHLSVYHLTIEPNTYFAKYKPILPDEDLAYQMLDKINAKTQLSDLNRYEISAYSKSGHRCFHNYNYWQFGDYVGIGAGAHGKISFPHRVIRQVRHRDPNLYMKQAALGNAISQEKEIARSELAFEFMLNALRLREGFALSDFYNRTGLPLSAIENQLEEAYNQGFIEKTLTHVYPTERGFDFLNDLQSLFL